MQQAIPYRTWLSGPIEKPIVSTLDNLKGESKEDIIKRSKKVKNMVSENAVLVIGLRGCCMCHVMKRLLLGLGVNPVMYEVDEEDEIIVIDELATIDGGRDGRPQFPSLFIGGRLFGGLDRLMAAHISGDLIPILKQAGALWL